MRCYLTDVDTYALDSVVYDPTASPNTGNRWSRIVAEERGKQLAYKYSHRHIDHHHLVGASGT